MLSACLLVLNHLCTAQVMVLEAGASDDQPNYLNYLINYLPKMLEHLYTISLKAYILLYYLENK